MREGLAESRASRARVDRRIGDRDRLAANRQRVERARAHTAVRVGRLDRDVEDTGLCRRA